MPFIDIRTNTLLSQKSCENVKTALGKAIEDIPGKTEKWLMLEFSGENKLYFRGNGNMPIAFIGVSVCGHSDPKYYDILTRDICEIIEREFDISKENIYVRYSETDNWGWNGNNF